MFLITLLNFLVYPLVAVTMAVTTTDFPLQVTNCLHIHYFCGSQTACYYSQYREEAPEAQVP